VIEWIDAYAERFKNLTDPVWLELINDPNYRWYKEGREYRNLFRFHERDKHPETAAAVPAAEEEKILIGGGPGR